MCPYKFFLTYIKQYDKQPLFFASYGSFMHKIIEMYQLELLSKEELPLYYLRNFSDEVRGKAPKPEIFKTYFDQGLDYLRNIEPRDPNTVGVEQKVDFSIDDKPFTGIVDRVVVDENGLTITDNKSRTLKPRSKRKKPTKADEELDEYLRQLYIYSIPLQEKYNLPVHQLSFNCFRNKETITEPFVQEKQDEARQWATELIQKIEQNEDWGPDMEFWKCRYLCDLNHECDYYQMNRR